MFKSCAQKITSFLAVNKEIDSSEYDVYAYGFEVLISFIFNSIMIIATGILCNKIIHTIIFLTCYCPVRQFAGGYHAENYKRCSLTFLGMFLVTVFTDKYLVASISPMFLGIYTFISYAGIYSLSPVEHRNNPLNEGEKKKYKKMARLISSIIVIFILVALTKNSLHNYAFYAGSSLFWIFIMLVLGIIKNIRRV